LWRGIGGSEESGVRASRRGMVVKRVGRGRWGWDNGGSLRGVCILLWTMSMEKKEEGNQMVTVASASVLNILVVL